MISQFPEIRYDDIFTKKCHVYQLLKSSYYELFGVGKHGNFLIQKFDGGVIEYFEIVQLN